MPHLSKTKPSVKIMNDLDHKIVSFLTDTNDKTRKLLFKELLTKTERLMMAKRLTLVFMINEGYSIRNICKALKISPSTVSRFQMAIRLGNFSETSRRFGKNQRGNRFVKWALALANVPFEAQKKSLGQLLDETYRDR